MHNALKIVVAVQLRQAIFWLQPRNYRLDWASYHLDNRQI